MRPSIWQIAVFSFGAGAIMGCAGGDNTAEPEPDPPSIEITAIRQADTGQPVDPGNVRGEIEVVVQIEHAPAGACVELVIDGTTASPCVAAARPTTGAPVAARVVRTGSVVIVMALNTADFTPNDVVKYFNGPRALSARTSLGAGQPVQSAAKLLTFNNQNFIRVNVAGPTGATVWRGGDISLTATPVIYTPGVVVDHVTVTGTWSSGSGIDLGNGPGQASPPVRAPFNVGIPSGQMTREEMAAFIVKAFLGDGQNHIAEYVFQTQIDNVAPRVVFNKAPSSGIENGEFSYNALRLNRPTGPYPAGTLINIARLSGGSFISPHAGAPNPHVHGNMFIFDPIGGTTLGPFPDPEFVFGDPNGHGDIIPTTLPSLAFRFTGSVVDGSPLTLLQVKAYRAVGTCDGPQKIDDVLLQIGTTSGSVAQNTFDVLNSAANFDVTVQLFGNNTFQPTTICIDVLAQDSGQGANGQPGPSAQAFSQHSFDVKY